MSCKNLRVTVVELHKAEMKTTVLKAMDVAKTTKFQNGASPQLEKTSFGRWRSFAENALHG